MFVTIDQDRQLAAGRVLQIRQEAKSPSAVPASPPVTIVMPSPPGTRFCISAVPGAIAYCTSMTEVTGMTFHSRLAEVADEVAAQRVRVGRRHRHLAERLDERHAHRDEGGAVAVVQVQVVEARSLALLDEQAEAGR